MSQIKNTAIVHTSGSIGLMFLRKIYLTMVCFTLFKLLTKSNDINISEIPFCIEGNSLEFEKQLIKIAKALSNNVVKMNSQQRKQLHIAAVFACNFSNHMYSIADDLLAKKNIDFKILLPLIRKTNANLEN